MHFAQTSVALHLSFLTAHLYQEKISTGAIAVTQACCEPVLGSTTEQLGMHRVTHHTDSNCMLYIPDQSFRFPLPKIQSFRQGTSKKLRRQQSKSKSKSRGMGRALLWQLFLHRPWRGVLWCM